jgi:Zn-dependent protease with chaperone function
MPTHRFTIARWTGRALVVLASLGLNGCSTTDSVAGPPADHATAPQVKAELAYRRIIEDLARHQKLDDDRVAAERMRRTTGGLIQAAAQMKPVAATWAWEVHSTSDSRYSAFCIYGGKILVGSSFVTELGLDDAELATLLGHEMAHALAEHTFVRTDSARDVDPAVQQAAVDRGLRQEIEADEIGMRLTYLAGWPIDGMLRFHAKIAQRQIGTFSSTHPAPAERFERAQSFARQLQSEQEKGRPREDGRPLKD